MSHTHDDRVAKPDPGFCEAYGCPLLGSLTTATQGGGEWYCFCHFGREVGQFQRITAELHRLSWLAKAITDARSRTAHRGDWPLQYQRIVHDFGVQGRNDLNFAGNAANRRDTESWIVKLEAELRAMVDLVVVPTKPTPRAMHQTEFQKIEFEVPA